MSKKEESYLNVLLYSSTGFIFRKNMRPIYCFFAIGTIFIIFINGLLAVSVLSELNRRAMSNEAQVNKTELSKTPILFADAKDVEIIFPVTDFKNNVNRTLKLTLNTEDLNKRNVTIEQVKRGRIEISSEGKEEIIIEGLRYDLGLEEGTFITYQGAKGEPMFTIDIHHFLELNISDVKDDPAFVPLAPLNIQWTLTPKCVLESMTVILSSSTVEVKMNGNLVTVYNVSKESEQFRNKVAHVRQEGLLLATINPSTCKTTMEFIAYTSDISGYRDLLWGLRSISPGKLVLLSSLRDGSSFLGESVRSLLKKMGSIWIPFYFYRDSWLNLFIKGGKTIQDVLIPNTRSLKTSGNPLSFHFDAEQLVPQQPYECSSWPSTERWEARKVFCEENDGFSSLCDCDKPFEFKERNQDSGEGVEIPFIFIIGNRTRHLFHLFQSLAPQKDATKDKFLLVTDGYHEDATRLSYILGLKLLVHKPQGIGATCISMNLRFALFHGLQEFPNAKAFILLEDDLLLSSDFYSFMHQLEPVFIDKSVFCVSAFNHVSYPHTSGDPTLTYRVESYPAYGWMMPRYIIEEIIPKWLPADFDHDWDYFIGSKLVRNKRECIVPDINRSYHWSTKGVHMTASYASEILFLSRDINHNSNTILQPIERLMKENYEKEFTELLKNATPVVFKGREDLDKVAAPGKALVIYVSKINVTDCSSFRLFAEELEIWNLDCRDNHHSAWRMLYKNATVFVIGVPFSKYRSYMPKDHQILQGDKSTDMEIYQGENIVRASHKFHTHANFSLLPEFNDGTKR